MTSPPRRGLVLTVLAVSMALLLPGIFMPVLTIRGVLTRDGVAAVAPQLLEKGLTDDTIAALSSLIDPNVLKLMTAFGGDLRQIIIAKLAPELSRALQEGGEIEVYQQTRSIIGSVRELYDVGSPLPATLILLFSVVVPVTKAVLVAWATLMASATARARTLRFVETIAKWSMADVFAVALFIVFLAAQATQQPPGAPDAAPPIVAFTADFGPGFYWFAAYCLFSLASQQFTARVARQGSTAGVPS